jgi:transposase-like protein
MEIEASELDETTTPTVIEGDEIAAAEARPEDTEVSERANLARYMTEEEQKKLARKVIERHSDDVGAREGRMKKLKQIQEAYALVTKPKSRPFNGCANISTPAVTAPILQISARLFDMTWPSTGRVFNVVPATAADQTYAHTTESFANSYLRYNMSNMGTSMADTIQQKCAYGSSFRRTGWDSYMRRIKSDRISIDDFVAPFAHRTSDPSMADVPHYTLQLHLTWDDIQDYGDEKLFVNTDKIKKENRGDHSVSGFVETTRKIDGVSPGEGGDDSPRQVLEHHCRWKLPNDPETHAAFDGKRHYVYIVVDAATEEVLRVCLREEDDPDDKRRFDRETAKFQQYKAELIAYQAALQAQQQQQMLMAAQAAAQPTIAGPMGVMMAQPPPMQMAPLPPEPQAVPVPQPIRKRQITFFTHYRCFQGEGFYGLGYGDMLLGLAVAMNTIINQHVDGVTLRNSKPAFMSRQVRMQRGSVAVQPGEFIEVDGPINQIRDAIMWLDPPQNDPSTVPLIKMLDAMKDTMAGSADLMSGEIPGSNQTKAGMQMLTEQMMMPITVLARQTREEFKHELDKIWRCFGVFLEDEEIAEFLNVDTNQPQQVNIGRWMFSPTVHLVPASDPRAKSQRVEDHQRLFAYVMSNPFIQQGPAAPAIMRQLTEEGFRIHPDGEKLISLLPPAQPPGPPPPPPQKPYWAEDAGFMRGQDSPVHPDDNDDEHVAMHMEYLRGGEAQVMDKTGRNMAEKHIRGHLAAKQEKKGAQFEQLKQQQQPPFPQPNGGALGPLAGGAPGQAPSGVPQ